VALRGGHGGGRGVWILSRHGTGFEREAIVGFRLVHESDRRAVSRGGGWGSGVFGGRRAAGCLQLLQQPPWSVFIDGEQ